MQVLELKGANKTISKRTIKSIKGNVLIYGFVYLMLNKLTGDCESFITLPDKAECFADIFAEKSTIAEAENKKPVPVCR